MSSVLIIGGGVIGLAIAVELSLRGASVTIVERGVCAQGATWAAAGMLAPEAEQLEGSLRELGIRSRALYSEWISKLMHLTNQDCGYRCCGILTPTLAPQPHRPEYIDRAALDKRQQGLSDTIAGALWFAEDGQVDNRRLAEALVMAARSLGVNILEGTNVYQIATSGDRVTHLDTSQGHMQADRYLLATGAWTRELMPLPVSPRKGQMLSVFDRDRRLQRVIFGSNVYIVPRQDGTTIIGATVEDVGFTAGNTAAGIRQLLSNAIAIYPAIADMNIQSTWWGFRPYAPNEMPILGASMYENLGLATGHYRNGILLAPITARFMADWIDGTIDPLMTDFRQSQPITTI
jgi:glycine oxidase ThiO